MVDFFTYMAIILGVLCVCLIISQIYIRVRSMDLKVGDLVRCSFTACPAVLTGALWGHGFDPNTDLIPFYAHSNTYDTVGGSTKQYWSFDAANALHCDVYGAGFSTYSTWISSAGQNYRNLVSLSYLSVTNRYYGSIQTCSGDADCQTNTFIPCGPGYMPPFNTKSLWDNSTMGIGTQCPPNTSCSICIDPPGSALTNLTKCQNYPATATDTGTCILNTPSNMYSCTNVNEGTITGKFCSGAIYENNNQQTFPHPFQANICDPANNLSASGRCDGPILPDFCNFNQNGNIDCLYGQQCIANPNTNDPSNWPFNTASNICSGTVLPDIVIKLDWIAEGVVTSITTGTGTPKYNVQWNRIQNLYNGIGPSPLWCQNGQCRFSDDAVQDTSWQYNDCRFILQDNVDTNSRHYDVSRALLGTSLSDPMGWTALSQSKYVDSGSITYVISSVTMYISTASVGGIDTSEYITSPGPGNANSQAARFFGIPPNNGVGITTYAATSWNLRAQNLPIENLQKIYFYSIMPVDFGPPTDKHANDHVNEYKRTLQRARVRFGGKLIT
jgi:hypothetical protein